MNIVHELIQLDFGGVENVIKNIIKFDKTNKHTVVAYKEGSFRKEFEDMGVKIQMPDDKNPVSMDADVIHVHTGGAISEMAVNLGEEFPVIETIHSPIRSPIANKYIKQRVGVSGVVSSMNNQCVTIHNGIDFDRMHDTRAEGEMKKELNIPDGVPVVGRLGRIGKDKGLEPWLLTCYYLQQQGINFIPLIVGGEARDITGYVGKLKLMCESLPVKNVIWTGHKSDVANYLQVMDVFLYPSPTEGFGLVYAEAMYCGAVVVAYKTDVTMEVLGGYSILTDQNVPALVEGVKKALDERIRYAIIPIAGELVESEYSAERMSMDYQDLYRKAVLIG